MRVRVGGEDVYKDVDARTGPLRRYLPPETDRFLQAPSPSLVAARDTDTRGLLRPPSVLCINCKETNPHCYTNHITHHLSVIQSMMAVLGTFLP